MAKSSLLLLWCVLQLSVVATSFIDITRSKDGDVFTSPNNDACEDTTKESSCEEYNSVRTEEQCVSLDNCCSQCKCSADSTTYLRHEKRCIESENLTSTLFNDVNQGCSYRLVPNDYSDDHQRGSKPCLFTDLSLQVIDTSASGNQLIDICGIYTWSISSCSVLTGAFYDNGQWMDLWDAGSRQAIFSVEKRLGVMLYLKWNDTLPTRYHGYIISLDVRCGRKFGLSPEESCLLFKVQGTQMDARPSTAPPTNITQHPTQSESRKEERSTDLTVIVIIVSVICGGLIGGLVVFMVILWLRQRGSMCTSDKEKGERNRNLGSWQKTDEQTNINSPPEYQCVNPNDGPIYTTPSKPSGYQDLLVNQQKNTYQPLVHNNSAKSINLGSSSSPHWHTPQEPGNDATNDDPPHVYHVLEGP